MYRARERMKKARRRIRKFNDNPIPSLLVDNMVNVGLGVVAGAGAAYFINRFIVKGDTRTAIFWGALIGGITGSVISRRYTRTTIVASAFIGGISGGAIASMRKIKKYKYLIGKKGD